MASENQTQVHVRILVERPVAGVMHSLQSKDGAPINAKSSTAGEPLAFDFAIRIAPGPKFFGDHVRREGPMRRFIYICIGQSAGDCASPWQRRMKIDIHDTPQSLLDGAAAGKGLLEISVDGTGKDATPACATVRVTGRRLV